MSSASPERAAEPLAPVPTEVQFYRNVAANAPYADVSSAPPKGNPHLAEKKLLPYQ